MIVQHSKNIYFKIIINYCKVIVVKKNKNVMVILTLSCNEPRKYAWYELLYCLL